MSARVLVLGATGFVGRALMRHLAESEWAEPVGASRRPVSSSNGWRFLQCDARDEAALGRALDGAAAVVNCVAGAPEDMVAGAGALRNVLRGMPAAPRLVHFSSMAAYGASTGRIDEDAPLDQAAPVASYAGAKVATERLLADIPGAVMLRPGCIYGPHSDQWSGRIATLLRAHRIGDLGAAGDGCSNLVYIDDVVRAVSALLHEDSPTASVPRAYNLAMASAPDWNTYFSRYARLLGAVPVRRLPSWRLALEGKVLAPPLKILEILNGRLGGRLALPPPIPPSLLRLWRQDIRLCSRRAESELGLAWTPLDTGLRQTVASLAPSALAE